MEMAEMQRHRGDGVVFLWNLSAFLLYSAWVEIFSGLYNFPDAHAVLVVQPMHSMWTCLQPSMPLTQLRWHFLHTVYFRKQVYFLLFFCFQHLTFLACHPQNLHGISAGASVYFRKQVYFLLCYTHNLGDISKGVFKSIFNHISSPSYLCL